MFINDLQSFVGMRFCLSPCAGRMAARASPFLMMIPTLVRRHPLLPETGAPQWIILSCLTWAFWTDLIEECSVRSTPPMQSLDQTLSIRSDPYLRWPSCWDPAWLTDRGCKMLKLGCIDWLGFCFACEVCQFSRSLSIWWVCLPASKACSTLGLAKCAWYNWSSASRSPKLSRIRD